MKNELVVKTLTKTRVWRQCEPKRLSRDSSNTSPGPDRLGGAEPDGGAAALHVDEHAAARRAARHAAGRRRPRVERDGAARRRPRRQIHAPHQRDVRARPHGGGHVRERAGAAGRGRRARRSRGLQWVAPRYPAEEKRKETDLKLLKNTFQECNGRPIRMRVNQGAQQVKSYSFRL